MHNWAPHLISFSRYFSNVSLSLQPLIFFIVQNHFALYLSFILILTSPLTFHIDHPHWSTTLPLILRHPLVSYFPYFTPPSHLGKLHHLSLSPSLSTLLFCYSLSLGITGHMPLLIHYSVHRPFIQPSTLVLHSFIFASSHLFFISLISHTHLQLLSMHTSGSFVSTQFYSPHFFKGSLRHQRVYGRCMALGRHMA